MQTKKILLAGAAPLLAASLMMTPALAADRASGQAMSNHAANTSAEQQRDAKQLVKEATNVVDKMKQDPNLAKYMKKAKGIYIVPEFGRGAFVIGARGGAGVMLAHNNGNWSNPAFFDFGAVSLGPQAGGSGGPVAFLLMTNDAVKNFRDGNVFSLNAGAGLSIVNYSANAQASAGKGDIIFWTDTSGAYVGATVSVSDIGWDSENNQAYYGKKVSAKEVLAGRVQGPNASQLKSALPS